MNSDCEKVIPQNMEDSNPERVQSESQEGKNVADEKVVQKLSDRTHIFYLEHEYGEKKDCEVAEIESKMTGQRRSRRN